MLGGTLVLALAVATATVFASASAQISPPTRVFGTATLNGQPAPSGAQVQARIGTTVCGTGTVGQGGNYVVDVASSSQTAGCGNNAESVSFTINGTAATPSAAVTFQSGAFVRADLTAPATGPAPTPTPTPSGPTVTYQPGWNLVSAPAGTVFSQAQDPLYTFPPGATEYTVVPNSSALASGRGYWAFFNAATTVTLTGTPGGSASFNAPASAWFQIGNPGIRPATVSGADSVVTYDPVAGAYVATTTLQPGQGAWAISLAGGTITVTVNP